MDVFSSPLRVSWTFVCYHLAYVRPILARGIDPDAVAAPFQAKSSTDTERLCVSLNNSSRPVTAVGADHAEETLHTTKCTLPLSGILLRFPR